MKERQKDHQRLLNNLLLIQRQFGAAQLRELLGISPNTWTNRMKEPWRLFSYDDFKAISIYCKIDFTQLMEGTLQIR